MNTQAGAPLWLAPDSDALRGVLEQGQWRDAEGRPWAAQPQEVGEDGRVRVALSLPRSSARPAAQAWAQALRLPSLTAAATPCVAVWLYGAAQGWPVSVPVALSALLGALSLQLAVNLLNDVEDHARLIDLPGTLGGAGVIQAGDLTAAQVRRVAYGLLALGLLAGVPALWRAPGPLLLIGAVAALGAWGYSAGPGLKYRALGDATVAALCGPCLTLGFSFAAFGRADAMAWSVGGVMGLAAVAILHVNNYQDIAADRARGAVTVASLLGEAASRRYLATLYILALTTWTTGALLSNLSPTWALALPWVASLPAARLTTRLLSLPPTDPSLRGARWQAAQAHLLLGLGVCAAMLAALLSA